MKSFKKKNYCICEHDFENAFEDMDSFRKRKKKKKEDPETEEKSEEFFIPGSIYELPYGAFEKETGFYLKILEKDQFHPMLYFFKYQKTSSGTFNSKWSLGTSKINAITIKQKYTQNRGYVYELAENSIKDRLHGRRYPLKRTYFFIHPFMMFPYKYNNAPSNDSYRGHIGIEIFKQILSEYERIKKESGVLNHA
jgi:hypothetical protein